MYRFFLLFLSLTTSFVYADSKTKSYDFPSIGMKLGFYADAKPAEFAKGWQYTYQLKSQGDLQLNSTLTIDTTAQGLNIVNLRKGIIRDFKKNHERYEVNITNMIGEGESFVQLTGFSRERPDLFTSHIIYMGKQATIEINQVMTANEAKKQDYDDVEYMFKPYNYTYSFPEQHIELILRGRLHAKVSSEDKAAIEISDCNSIYRDIKALVKIIPFEELDNLRRNDKLMLKGYKADNPSIDVNPLDYEFFKHKFMMEDTYDENSSAYFFTLKPDSEKLGEVDVSYFSLIKKPYIILCRIHKPYVTGIKFATKKEQDLNSDFEVGVIKSLMKNLTILE